MAMDPDLSREDLPTLFQRLASRDLTVFYEIWRRLLPRLRGWTKHRLEQEPALASTYDEDDALQSSLFRMLRTILRGRIPPITAEADFFRLFRTIMDRRIKALARHSRRLVPHDLDLFAFGQKLGTVADHVPDGVNLLDSGLPEPIAESIAVEELLYLLALLGPELRTIAERRLNGVPVDEVAEQLGLSTRSIERRLMAIRDIWKRARFDS